MIALWTPSLTAFVLVLDLNRNLDRNLDRETVSSRTSTSTGETPEYEYDQEALRLPFKAGLLSLVFHHHE